MSEHADFGKALDTILALRPLLIDEQSELIFKSELSIWWQFRHLPQALGQRAPFHLGQVVVPRRTPEGATLLPHPTPRSPPPLL